MTPLSIKQKEQILLDVGYKGLEQVWFTRKHVEEIFKALDIYQTKQKAILRCFPSANLKQLNSLKLRLKKRKVNALKPQSPSRSRKRSSSTARKT